MKLILILNSLFFSFSVLANTATIVCSSEKKLNDEPIFEWNKMDGTLKANTGEVTVHNPGTPNEYKTANYIEIVKEDVPEGKTYYSFMNSDDVEYDKYKVYKFELGQDREDLNKTWKNIKNIIKDIDQSKDDANTIEISLQCVFERTLFTF